MTAIPLAAFIPAFQDDTDVLINAVHSLVGLEGLREILVCDTGLGFYHENFRAEQQSVKDFCTWAQAEGWPVVYDAGLAIQGKRDFSALRNYSHEVLGDYSWIIHLDSDEVLTNEIKRDLQALLSKLTPEVVTIAPRWLTLYPDEQTYAATCSGFLSHGRIYQPKRVTWVNPLHEHQNYRGTRYEWEGHFILHCRQLFERRCQRQCGHGADAWSGFSTGLRPLNELGHTVSWLPLVWPGEEEHEQ